MEALLGGRQRDLVLEITEHVRPEDYAAIRAAMAQLGPHIRLAVDDGGAGFAGIRHIVELAPQFLKLDISLTSNVDRDPTRQAMIAGLCHYAARSGCLVIAEGIERAAERAALRDLGVPLGQGYLLGRPGPPDTWAGTTRRRPDRGAAASPATAVLSR